MGDEFLYRAVNEGFSGGEKKRNEVLQMALLEPRLAILDETDSGLDIDALQVVANGINALRSPERAMIVVTHYQRLLDYVVPDFVHVLSQGRIVRSGGKELAQQLEQRGYGWLETPAPAGAHRRHWRSCGSPDHFTGGGRGCGRGGPPPAATVGTVRQLRQARRPLQEEWLRPGHR